MVLLALVDANYRFTAIQVGDFGRKSDGEVYANSPLGRAMASKTLQVPQDAFLLGGEDLGKMQCASSTTSPQSLVMWKCGYSRVGQG